MQHFTNHLGKIDVYATCAAVKGFRLFFLSNQSMCLISGVKSYSSSFQDKNIW